MTEFSDRLLRLSDSIEQVIQGKTEEIQLALVCLFAQGHLLMEDVPGVGKTMLARSLAASIDGSFRRIQFTPDLLPSDVSGVSIFDQTSGEFRFHPGPVFANIVIADEINRASPKTQSAMLEVMAERQVTIDGFGHPVPVPFMVIATQNPIELEGTYRLPEAQLDRFMMRISIGHPDVAATVRILKQHSAGAPLEEVRPVLRADELGWMIEHAGQTYIADGIFEYVARVAEATCNHPDLKLGVSPRGSLGLVRASRALAAADGREYVTPEDIKVLAEPVLAHRLLLTPEAELQGKTAAMALREAMGTVPVPQRRVSA